MGRRELHLHRELGLVTANGRAGLGRARGPSASGFSGWSRVPGPPDIRNPSRQLLEGGPTPVSYAPPHTHAVGHYAAVRSCTLEYGVVLLHSSSLVIMSSNQLHMCVDARARSISRKADDDETTWKLC